MDSGRISSLWFIHFMSGLFTFTLGSTKSDKYNGTETLAVEPLKSNEKKSKPCYGTKSLEAGNECVHKREKYTMRNFFLSFFHD